MDIVRYVKLLYIFNFIRANFRRKRKCKCARENAVIFYILPSWNEHAKGNMRIQAIKIAVISFIDISFEKSVIIFVFWHFKTKYKDHASIFGKYANRICEMIYIFVSHFTRTRAFENRSWRQLIFLLITDKKNDDVT